jgi:hypothetical protein
LLAGVCGGNTNVALGADVVGSVTAVVLLAGGMMGGTTTSVVTAIVLLRIALVGTGAGAVIVGNIGDACLGSGAVGGGADPDPGAGGVGTGFALKGIHVTVGAEVVILVRVSGCCGLVKLLILVAAVVGSGSAAAAADAADPGALLAVMVPSGAIVGGPIMDVGAV